MLHVKLHHSSVLQVRHVLCLCGTQGQREGSEGGGSIPFCAGASLKDSTAGEQHNERVA